LLAGFLRYQFLPVLGVLDVHELIGLSNARWRTQRRGLAPAST
jgi:hypothetical protein